MRLVKIPSLDLVPSPFYSKNCIEGRFGEVAQCCEARMSQFETPLSCNCKTIDLLLDLNQSDFNVTNQPGVQKSGQFRVNPTKIDVFQNRTGVKIPKLMHFKQCDCAKISIKCKCGGTSHDNRTIELGFVRGKLMFHV